VCVCGWVCYHDNSKFRASRPHQTGFVGKGTNHLQLIKFWPSHAPGNGVCGGALAPPYYSQRAVFASPLGVFFITLLLLSYYDLCLIGLYFQRLSTLGRPQRSFNGELRVQSRSSFTSRMLLMSLN